jgi:hypothetical protein
MPARSGLCNRIQNVGLRDASVAIIQELITAGYHQTPQEVTQAAMEPLMARHS